LILKSKIVRCLIIALYVPWCTAYHEEQLNFESSANGETMFPSPLEGLHPSRGAKERVMEEDTKSGWEFTKLLTQIHIIFLNLKVLLQSSYSWKIGT